MTEPNPRAVARLMVSRASDPDNARVIEVMSRDVLMWESINRRERVFSDLSHPSMGDYYELAHLTLKRLGDDPGPLGLFEADWDVSPADEADMRAMDPTQKEA